MEIVIREVPASRKQTLASMLDTYLMEHYQYKETPTGPQSASEYIYFEDYWQEKGRFPYFIIAGDKVAGFVLVRTVFEKDESYFQISEFYITAEFRRKHIGTWAVELIWALHPGRWELQVLSENSRGMAFWTQCVEQFAINTPVITKLSEEDGTRIQFNFEVPTVPE